ncbi:NAD(P)/FAD-dependent oxidoreductase [Candidatus Uhrbacteria bacterium]|nr:NAD(P)/FAD-dependent oxidoreductase [Candidatus Uhrbacteria bacterium]
MRFVIIGGGIAGTTCAEELRKLQPEAEIVLVSEEAHPLYSRVLLPHYLKGKVPRERVFLKSEEWYGKQGIEWISDMCVVKLDSKNAFVELSDGRELPYDKVLIATGGDLQTLSEDLRGVSYLRTLDDADHLLQMIREKERPLAGAVYGGGFIACEYINLFVQEGIQTTAVFRGPRFWPRVLDAESGTLLNARLAAMGVTVMPETTIERLLGEKELEGFATHRGTVACGILGIGLGIASELAWVREAGIEVGKGVLANEYLETNAPNVYAAGDGAEFFDTVVGHERLVGTWMNALSQGRTVAKTMAGERTAFRLVSSYATNLLGLEIIFVGEPDRSHADEVLVRGSAADGGVTQLFLKQNRVVGATIIGRNADRMPITKLIDGQVDVEGMKKDLENPAVIL